MKVLIFFCAQPQDFEFAGKFLVFKMGEPEEELGPNNMTNPRYAEAVWEAVADKTGFSVYSLKTALKVIAELDGDLVDL